MINNPNSTPRRPRLGDTPDKFVDEFQAPQLTDAVVDSPKPEAPTEIKPAQTKGRKVSDVEIIMNGVTNGAIDVGEGMRILTDEQILNRASLLEAAKAIPLIEAQWAQQYMDEMDLSYKSRALSFGNGAAKSFGQFAVGSLRIKAMLTAAAYNAFNVGNLDWKPEDIYDYRMAMSLDAALEEVFPESPVFREEFLAGTMAKAVGPIVGGLVAATGAAVVGVGVVGSSLVGALANTTITSANYEEAIRRGATSDEALSATFLDMTQTAAIDFLPIFYHMRRIDTITNGGVKEILSAGFRGSAEQLLANATQQYLVNLTAKNIYDENRDLWEGVPESALTGAALGGTINAGTSALTSRYIKAKTIEAKAEAKDALRYMYEAYGEELTVEGRPLTKAEVETHLDELIDTEFAKQRAIQEAEMKGKKGKKGAKEESEVDSFVEELIAEEKALGRALTDEEIEARTKQKNLDNEKFNEELQEGLDEIRAQRTDEDLTKYDETPLESWLTNKREERRAKLGKKRTDAEPEIDELGVVETNQGSAFSGTKLTKAVRNKIANIWKVHMSTGGATGIDVRIMRNQRNSNIDAHNVRAHLNVARLNNAVVKFYGSKSKNMVKAASDPADKVPSDISQQLNNALHDVEARKLLPKELLEPLMIMRKHIDELSRQLIQGGVATGELAITIDKNIGVYVHRDYALYNPNIKWDKSTIPQEVWNKAVVTTKNKIRDGIRKKGKPDMTDRELTQQANKILNNILRTKRPDSIPKMFRRANDRVVEGKADKAALKLRREIDPAIRALMGEFDDVSINYANTINEVANLAERYMFHANIAKEFEGTLFFKKHPDLDNANAYQRGLGSKTGTRLDSMYMLKEVAEALTTESTNNQGFLYTNYLRALSSAKVSKTVFNAGTHARNLIGSSLVLVANGHLPGLGDAKALRSYQLVAYKTLGKYQALNDADLDDVLVDYVRKGLFTEGALSGELKALFRQSNFQSKNFVADNFKILENFAGQEGLGGKTSRGFRKATNLVEKLYAAEDILPRILMYELELARYQKADPNIKAEDVAALVRDKLYMNYGLANKFTQDLRKYPFAPFLVFPMEIIRTSFNSVQQGLTDIKSPNPEIKKIGWSRLAGMTSMTVGMTALSAVSMGVAGLTSERDRSYREFMAPWDKNSAPLYMSADPGQIRYINTSYTNPYEYFTNPFFAMVKGDPDRSVLEKGWDGIYELLRPLLNEELAVKHIREVMTNKKSTGSEIYNPEDDVGTIMAKSFMHMFKAWEPGTLSTAGRIYEASTDIFSEKEVGNEILSLFGFRVTTVDVKKSYGFRLREYRESIRNIRRSYNAIKFKKGVSDEEAFQAYLKADERHLQRFEDLERLTRDAESTGVSWQDLEFIMEEAGLAKRDIKALQYGIHEPFNP